MIEGLLMRMLARAFIIAVAPLVILNSIPLHTTPTLTSFVGGSASCSRPVVAVFFYMWYEDGLGGSHWNNTIYGLVVDKPVIGYYSSVNESVIRWQLNLIRKAGVNVLFLSWWGPNSYTNRVAKEVFKLLPEYGLKASIMVEPFLGGRVLDAVRYNRVFWSSVLNYIYSNFIERYPESYFKLYGKPLILTFAPVGIVYLPENNSFTFRVVALGVDLLRKLGFRADWDLWPNYLAPWVKPRSSIQLRIRVDGYVAITPRFDNTIACRAGAGIGCSLLLLDPTYSLRAYILEWEWVLEHLDKIHIIAIYSWNEYHERSEIEPHIDATEAPGLKYNPYNTTMFFTSLINNICLQK